jgi:RNA polymerase sigma factor (TIGR02999 family)
MDLANPPLTELLELASRGEPGALDQVFAALYPELRKIAHARLRTDGGQQDLQTTALVHESFLRLVRAERLALADRKHFFAYAAKTMRNIIVDAAREHLPHGGGGGRSAQGWRYRDPRDGKCCRIHRPCPPWAVGPI